MIRPFEIFNPSEKATEAEQASLLGYKKRLSRLTGAKTLITSISGKSQDAGQLEPNLEETYEISAILANLNLNSIQDLEAEIEALESLIQNLKNKFLVVISPSDCQKSPNQVITLAGVKPIRDAPVMTVETWAQIEKIIENPLRAAMHDFWEKGIKTIESSANQEDGLIGSIFFDIQAGEDLSAANKEIALKNGGILKNKRGIELYAFKRSVTIDTPTAEIVKWSRGIAAEFESQKTE